MAATDLQPKKPDLKPLGLIAAGVAFAGVLCWWFSHKPSSPDSHTPTSQHSVSSLGLQQPSSIFTNSLGAEMVHMPPGEFMLGSAPEERAHARAMGAADSQVENEGRQPRRARIRHGFWIGRTELTVGQWQQFVNEAHYQSDATTGFAILDSYPEKKPDDHPVAWITWRDAVAFCEWLTQRERGANRLPERYIYRLPSEAEWEYACRAGQPGAMFWWGDSPTEGSGRLHWRGDKGAAQSTRPVDSCGARGRNAFGLADMLGNVRELCLDAWDPAGAAEVLCADYTRSKARALRGGSFKSPAFDVRIARRWSSLYSCGGSDIGFRLSCGINLSNEVARILQTLVVPDAKPSLTPLPKKLP
jgi:formylglycine-generating enzyme required for sulfatase activity